MNDVPIHAAPTTLPADWRSLAEVPVLIYEEQVPFAWPDRLDLVAFAADLDVVLAAVLLAIGVGSALYAYKAYRPLAALALAALGVWGGWWIGNALGATAAGMIVGGLVAAAAAWPSATLSVATCAAIVGGVVGASTWRTTGLDDAYLYAGGAVGATFLTMLTFISLRAAAVLTFATLGVVLTLLGALGLLLRYDVVNRLVDQHVGGNPLVLPITLLSLVVTLSFVQHAWWKSDELDKKA